MIKENALFLLELSNNENENFIPHQKKSPQSMQNVRESVNPRFSGTSFNYNGNLIPVKNRNRFSAQILERKSTFSENIESPELLWPTPDIFSCFDLLSSTSNDEPVEFADQNNGDAFGQRPLSEVSFDYGNGVENMSIGSQISKFHRSMSMGHGWANSNLSNNNSNLGKKGFNGGKNEGNVAADAEKVVFRRKNRAACDDGLLN